MAANGGGEEAYLACLRLRLVPSTDVVLPPLSSKVVKYIVER